MLARLATSHYCTFLVAPLQRVSVSARRTGRPSIGSATNEAPEKKGQSRRQAEGSKPLEFETKGALNNPYSLAHRQGGPSRVVGLARFCPKHVVLFLVKFSPQHKVKHQSSDGRETQSIKGSPPTTWIILKPHEIDLIPIPLLLESWPRIEEKRGFQLLLHDEILPTHKKRWLGRCQYPVDCGRRSRVY